MIYSKNTSRTSYVAVWGVRNCHNSRIANVCQQNLSASLYLYLSAIMSISHHVKQPPCAPPLSLSCLSCFKMCAWGWRLQGTVEQPGRACVRTSTHHSISSHIHHQHHHHHYYIQFNHYYSIMSSDTKYEVPIVKSLKQHISQAIQESSKFGIYLVNPSLIGGA